MLTSWMKTWSESLSVCLAPISCWKQYSTRISHISPVCDAHSETSVHTSDGSMHSGSEHRCRNDLSWPGLMCSKNRGSTHACPDAEGQDIIYWHNWITIKSHIYIGWAKLIYCVLAANSSTLPLWTQSSSARIKSYWIRSVINWLL